MTLLDVVKPVAGFSVAVVVGWFVAAELAIRSGTGAYLAAVASVACLAGWCLVEDFRRAWIFGLAAGALPTSFFYAYVFYS